MKMVNLKSESAEFAGFLENWFAKLPVLKLTDLVKQPEKLAIVSVDIINGFCYAGPLSSPRVAGIVHPICQLFTSLHQMGVKHFVLTQDTHEADAVEFADFPPHCVRSTTESETVDEFKELPFFSEFVIFPKNSINSALNSGLAAWVESHPEVDTFIVVGDCSDLCTYQLAMFLRLDANARQLKRRVVVPENCVQTYDTPVALAVEKHLTAHPGDWMHVSFLYHMFLNGVEIVKKLE
jgi:nicotinamidase-related amidase